MKLNLAAAAAVLAAGLLALTAGLWSLGRGRAALVRWASPGLETRVEQFLSGLPAGKDDMRLVVGTLEAVQSASAESRKSLFGVDLGTTKVALSVPVRIHYAVDLSDRRAVEFRVDAPRRRFLAVFPDPEVQAVEILLQDRRSTVDVGWARTRERSGRALEGEIERGLYAAARKEASTPAALAAAKNRARGVLVKFVAAYLRREGTLDEAEGFREIAVRFRGDLDDEDTARLPAPGRDATARD